MNKRTVRIFIALFCCILVLAGAIASVAFLNERNRILREYREKLELDMDRMMKLYSSQMKAAYDACINIFNSRWFKHYRSVNGYYKNEFDVLKRNEIMSEIAGLTQSLPYVEDILVISPSLDTVICRHGWLSDSFYETAFGLVKIESREKDWPIVTSVHPNYSIYTVQDPNMRYEKSVITLVFRNQEFVSSFNSMKIPETEYLRVTLGDASLAQIGEIRDGAVLLERRMQIPLFQLQMGYKSTRDVVAEQMDTTMVLIFLIIALASLIISFLASVFITKPVTDLVTSVGGNQKAVNDPVRFLSAYLEAFSNEQTRLRAENDGMQSAHARFLHLIEKDILLGLLTNPGLSDDSPSLRVIFPWMKDGYVLILAVLLPKYGNAPLSERNDFFRFKTLPDEYFRHVVIREEDVLFFWTAKDKMENLLERIREEMKNSYCLYSISQPLSSLQEIRETYTQCSQQLWAQRTDWLNIPMNLETKMQAALQSGKIENCLGIMAKAQAESNPDALIQLFVRAAMEYEMPIDHLLQRYHLAAQRGEINQQWALLSECAEKLCKIITVEKQRGSRLQISAVCGYIDRNFADSGLCIDQVAEHFSMHPALLSKQFKAYTGKTFSAYLQDLRLSTARQMLLASRKSILEIAAEVGYANYQTFLRAFQRSYNVSPTDFREQMTIAN